MYSLSSPSASWSSFQGGKLWWHIRLLEKNFSFSLHHCLLFPQQAHFTRCSAQFGARQSGEHSCQTVILFFPAQSKWIGDDWVQNNVLGPDVLLYINYRVCSVHILEAGRNFFSLWSDLSFCNRIHPWSLSRDVFTFFWYKKAGSGNVSLLSATLIDGLLPSPILITAKPTTVLNQPELRSVFLPFLLLSFEVSLS